MVKVDIGLFWINLEKYTSEKTITKTITKTIKETIKEKIVTLLRNNRTLTVKDLEVILKIKKPTIQYHLNKLRRDGILLHQGAIKSGYWVVNDKQINSNLEATRKIELHQNVPLNVGQSVGHDGKESSQKKKSK